MQGKEKELSKDELEKLLKEQQEAFLAKGKEVKVYAADTGRTKLKPGEYEATRRRRKDGYSTWIEELQTGEKAGDKS